jgi:hypothetical protein
MHPGVSVDFNPVEIPLGSYVGGCRAERALLFAVDDKQLRIIPILSKALQVALGNVMVSFGGHY